MATPVVSSLHSSIIPGCVSPELTENGVGFDSAGKLGMLELDAIQRRISEFAHAGLKVPIIRAWRDLCCKRIRRNVLQ